MRIRVRLFASLREKVGASELEVSLDRGATVADVSSRLRAEHPTLAAARFATAVNRAYATPDRVLADGDEVALIPPVSGG